MTDRLLSIDLGTTRLKVATFTARGRLIEQAARRHRATQRADDWWRDTVAAIGELDTRGVAGVTLSGRGGAGVFLDGAGEVVADPWADQRHADELGRLLAWRAEGDRFLPNYGAALVAKFLWLRTHRPALAARCRHAMYAKDVLLHRLCGEHVTDWSSGPDAAAWDPRLAEDFRLPSALLPRPALPWDLAGGLTAAAARATGLASGTPVAVGAHDGVCANVGAAATRSGQYAITLGTHAVVRTVALSPPAGAYRFYGLPPERHVIGGNAILGGRALDWLLDTTHAGGDRDAAYRDADAEAGEAGAGADGVVFLPFLAGQVAPERRPGASAAFAGLRASHGRGVLYRAVMEGVAFAVADIFDEIVGWCGAASRIRLTGGGAASRQWCGILASVLGEPLERSDDAVEGRGAAAFLAQALGHYAHYDDAAEAMAVVASRVRPAAGAPARYRLARDRWRRVRDAMREFDAAPRAPASRA